MSLDVGDIVDQKPSKFITGISTQAGGNYYGGGGFSVSNSGGYSPYLEIGTPGFGVFSTYGAHF